MPKTDPPDQGAAQEPSREERLHNAQYWHDKIADLRRQTHAAETQRAPHLRALHDIYGMSWQQIARVLTRIDRISKGGVSNAAYLDRRRTSPPTAPAEPEQETP